MTTDGAQASAAVAKYENLIIQFINHQISAPDFASVYLNMFANEQEFIGGTAFDILEYLFTSADGYVADPEARRIMLIEHPEWRKAGQGLDDEELRAEARDAYQRLVGN